MNIKRNGSYQQLPKHILKSLLKIADLVPQKSYVTLEATPIYAGRSWEQIHEFGFNILLPVLFDILSQRCCTLVHYAMVDDFTTDMHQDAQTFVDRMKYKPSEIFYESAFINEAKAAIVYLGRRGRTLVINDEVVLATQRYPRLRTRSGRVSCEVLDACFQGRKVGDYHVIAHPNDFIKQQEGMRAIVREMHENGPCPQFLNIFFKNDSVSRLYATNKDGITRRILL